MIKSTTFTVPAHKVQVAITEYEEAGWYVHTLVSTKSQKSAVHSEELEFLVVMYKEFEDITYKSVRES